MQSLPRPGKKPKQVGENDLSPSTPLPDAARDVPPRQKVGQKPRGPGARMDKGSERMLRFEEGKGIPTPVQPEHPWKAQKPHCRDSHGGLPPGQRLGEAQAWSGWCGPRGAHCRADTGHRVALAVRGGSRGAFLCVCCSLPQH